VFVPRKPRSRPPEPPKPREARKFKVVDVLTRQAVADDVPARQAIDALNGFRSIVDVNVYVWQPERERWRMLTFDESAELWTLREPSRAGDA
jgi:hypothetical protein